MENWDHRILKNSLKENREFPAKHKQQHTTSISISYFLYLNFWLSLSVEIEEEKEMMDRLKLYYYLVAALFYLFI